MRHDELLKTVDFAGHTSASFALHAVIELHKQQDITLPNGEWGTNCIECDGLFYPCPTIEAIEKELS
jgi:hypothetical protein